MSDLFKVLSQRIFLIIFRVDCKVSIDTLRRLFLWLHFLSRIGNGSTAIRSILLPVFYSIMTFVFHFSGLTRVHFDRITCHCVLLLVTIFNCCSFGLIYSSCEIVSLTIDGTTIGDSAFCQGGVSHRFSW